MGNKDRKIMTETYGQRYEREIWNKLKMVKERMKERVNACKGRQRKWVYVRGRERERYRESEIEKERERGKETHQLSNKKEKSWH